ncbi:aromatic-ring-hydroxylating dioxygenase subunit beta [Pseudomonas fluorescens]|uniref:p-cumate 2,3-dioxygenase system, small oxygenase component n=1 Tax=Pseudomonas fluorescens TaxID=294 RepID=A0A5E7BZY6_PSEFL|nr:aromatic-ring-hydroxylating dioxygenase subunit beta [Pseudomonas fluorescens]VVN97828.1 p-cumate 2,3-dioxygenase system, small oxygenase component [Pseudomonas fluorescens]
MLTRMQVEDFLFYEAELLDGWKLDEWAALYTEDARYEIASPATEDPINADPDQTLFLVADGIMRIRARAVRLSKKTAHAEYPHSKTRHLVTNVRVSPGNDDETRVRANFAVYRTKEETTTVYMGEAHLILVQDGDAIKVRRKRCILDLNSLYDQGRLTIIL